MAKNEKLMDKLIMTNFLLFAQKLGYDVIEAS